MTLTDGDYKEWKDEQERSFGTLLPVDIDEVGSSTPPQKTAGPKETYLHLLGIVEGFATLAADNGFDACDWYAIFDKPTADKYRTAAVELAEFAEHIQTLIELETT